MSLMSLLGSPMDQRQLAALSIRRRVVRIGGYQTPPPATYPGKVLWSNISGDGINSRGAISFPGTTASYLSRSEVDSRTLSTGNVDFWVAGWVYPSAVSSLEAIICRYNYGAANAREWVLQLVSGETSFIVSPDGTSTNSKEVRGPFVSAGVWSFVFAYYDAVNNLLSIRVNGGSFVTPVSGPGGVAVNMAPLTISQRLNNGSPADPFGGSMDQLCFGASPVGGIANVRNTIADALYNGGSGIAYNQLSTSQKSDWGLVSFWEMDELSGSRGDSHGANTLTVNGTLTAVEGKVEGPADNLDPVSSLTPVVGPVFEQSTIANRPVYSSSGYLTYDGSADKLTNANPLIANVSEWFGIWKINPTVISASGDNVLYSEEDGLGNGVVVALTTTGALKATVSGTSVTSSGTVSTGSFQTVAVRRLGTALTLFINGVADGTGTIAAPTTFTGVSTHIGGKVNAGGVVFNGRIEDVFISTNSGTDDDIASLSGAL